MEVKGLFTFSWEKKKNLFDQDIKDTYLREKI